MPFDHIDGRSTRGGSRPQAILHPHGNRGADLIETIRLERMSAEMANQNPLLRPDKKLFVPPHHTDPRAEGRSSKPGVGGPGIRPWTEKRWTRPQTAGAMRVHSSNALQDMMAADSPEPGESTHGGQQLGSRLASPMPQSPLPPGAMSASPGPMASWGGSVTSNANKGAHPSRSQQQSMRQRPQSAHNTLAEERQRQRLKQQHDETQERVMRKLRESQLAAAAQQEADFHRAWEQFYSEQNGAVADIERMLRLKDMEFVRRANAHCKNWQEEVFDRIQEQIDHGLRKREARGTYNTRWRHAQDDYLRTLKKKDAGVFRDIVIEEEYDPLENANARITYSSGKVNRKDPLKTELRAHEQEAAMVPGSSAHLMAQKVREEGLGRECLDVKTWANLDATPYGHFNKVVMKPGGNSSKPRGQPHSSSGERVMGNHYLPPRPLEKPEKLY